MSNYSDFDGVKSGSSFGGVSFDLPKPVDRAVTTATNLLKNGTFIKFGSRFVPYVGTALSLYDLAKTGYESAQSKDGYVEYDKSTTITTSTSTMTEAQNISKEQIANSAKASSIAKTAIDELYKTASSERMSLAETLTKNNELLSKSIIESVTLLHSELVNINTSLFGVMTYLDQFLSMDFAREEKTIDKVDPLSIPRKVVDESGKVVAEMSPYQSIVTQGYTSALQAQKIENIVNSLSLLHEKMSEDIEVKKQSLAKDSEMSSSLGIIGQKISEDIELKKEEKTVRALDGSVLGSISFYDSHASVGLREKMAMSQLPVKDLEGRTVGSASAVDGDVVRAYVDSHAITNQKIVDLDGIEVATAKPLDIALQKNATITRKTTDENNLELDDEDFDLMNIDFSLLESIIPDTRLSDEYKAMYSND